MKIYKVSCTYFGTFGTDETEYFKTIDGVLNYIASEHSKKFIITDKIKHELQTEKYIQIKPENEYQWDVSFLNIDVLNTDDMK